MFVKSILFFFIAIWQLIILSIDGLNIQEKIVSPLQSSFVNSIKKRNIYNNEQKSYLHVLKYLNQNPSIRRLSTSPQQKVPDELLIDEDKGKNNNFNSSITSVSQILAPASSQLSKLPDSNKFLRNFDSLSNFQASTQNKQINSNNFMQGNSLNQLIPFVSLPQNDLKKIQTASISNPSNEINQQQTRSFDNQNNFMQKNQQPPQIKLFNVQSIPNIPNNLIAPNQNLNNPNLLSNQPKELNQQVINPTNAVQFSPSIQIPNNPSQLNPLFKSNENNQLRFKSSIIMPSLNNFDNLSDSYQKQIFQSDNQNSKINSNMQSLSNFNQLNFNSPSKPDSLMKQQPNFNNDPFFGLNDLKSFETDLANQPLNYHSQLLTINSMTQINSANKPNNLNQMNQINTENQFNPINFMDFDKIKSNSPVNKMNQINLLGPINSINSMNQINSGNDLSSSIDQLKMFNLINPSNQMLQINQVNPQNQINQMIQYNQMSPQNQFISPEFITPPEQTHQINPINQPINNIDYPVHAQFNPIYPKNPFLPPSLFGPKSIYYRRYRK